MGPARQASIRMIPPVRLGMNLCLFRPQETGFATFVPVRLKKRPELFMLLWLFLVNNFARD